MNNWKNYTVNIGHVKQNTSTDVKFDSTRYLDIQHIFTEQKMKSFWENMTYVFEIIENKER